MSKVVLIMDMPEDCEDCPYAEDVSNTCGVFEMLGKSYTYEIPIEGKKPDWCPLRKLPERKSEEFGQTIINAARAEGWNACLDTIEGGADDA